MMTCAMTLRALAAATTVAALPFAAAPSAASELSDCYDYIMTQCETSISEYYGCIDEGFGLCDNQHDAPLVAGSLDLDWLPADQRRVVRAVLQDRGVNSAIWRSPFGSGDSDGGRGAGGSDGGRDEGRDGGRGGNDPTGR